MPCCSASPSSAPSHQIPALGQHDQHPLKTNCLFSYNKRSRGKDGLNCQLEAVHYKLASTLPQNEKVRDKRRHLKVDQVSSETFLDKLTERKRIPLFSGLRSFLPRQAGESSAMTPKGKLMNLHKQTSTKKVVLPYLPGHALSLSRLASPLSHFCPVKKTFKCGSQIFNHHALSRISVSMAHTRTFLVSLHCHWHSQPARHTTTASKEQIKG